MIDVKITQYKEDDPTQIKSSDYLSNKIILKNSQIHRYSGSAQASVQFHNVPRKTELFFYIRSIYAMNRGSYRVKIDKDGKANNWLVRYQSMFIGLCISIICCACLFKLLKLLCSSLNRMRTRVFESDDDDRRSSRDHRRNNDYMNSNAIYRVNGLNQR